SRSDSLEVSARTVCSRRSRDWPWGVHLATLKLVKRRTTWAGLSVAAAAVSAEILRRRMKESVRTARNVATARVGARMGVGWTAHRARRVFASAERREALDVEYQLKS